MCSDVHDSQISPCEQQHQPFHHHNLHAWTIGERRTMSTMRCAAWKPRLGLDLWWRKALCLAQNYRGTLMSHDNGNVSLVIFGQMHLVLKMWVWLLHYYGLTLLSWWLSFAFEGLWAQFKIRYHAKCTVINQRLSILHMQSDVSGNSFQAILTIHQTKSIMT